MFAAIILAAGASKRMGYPKALMPYRGRPFLTGILEASLAAGVDLRVVVLGYYANKIKQEIDLSDVIVTINKDLESGPIGSVRAGIRALGPHSVQAALVWPVDRPHVSLATVSALLDASRGTHQPIVVPVFQGRRGHPVLFARSVFNELLAAPNDQGARYVVRRDPTRVATVEAGDASVLEDFNTPDDYKELLRREDRVRGD